MSKRRDRPDGLPYRVYERRGIRTYSIGYNQADSSWAFRLSCAVTDKRQISELRAEAIRRASEIALGKPAHDTVAALIEAWFKYQETMPERSAERRADSTLKENRREGAKLLQAFGHMRVPYLIKSDAYTYLDACVRANRPEKGNKEISLMRTILEYGVRVGLLEDNPFDKVVKVKTIKEARYVTDYELDLALEVGRSLGGSRHIVALALKTAYLCVRRSVEVRSLTRDQITEGGIVWIAAKRQKSHAVQHGLIEWSSELRAAIDEAIAVKRNRLAGSWYIFGNLRGQKYTKGGWKKTLSELMKKCADRAAQEDQPFQPFSLQDCRPKGVSDKLARGDQDVMDATLHTSERMVRQIYDRRKVRIATPTK
jgi:hypothetical protein